MQRYSQENIKINLTSLLSFRYVCWVRIIKRQTQIQMTSMQKYLRIKYRENLFSFFHEAERQVIGCPGILPFLGILSMQWATQDTCYGCICLIKAIHSCTNFFCMPISWAADHIEIFHARICSTYIFFSRILSLVYP